MRPDLGGSGRDADSCQGQLRGPSVKAKSTNEMNALLRPQAVQRTDGSDAPDEDSKFISPA